MCCMKWVLLEGVNVKIYKFCFKIDNYWLDQQIREVLYNKDLFKVG